MDVGKLCRHSALSYLTGSQSTELGEFGGQPRRCDRAQGNEVAK